MSMIQTINPATEQVCGEYPMMTQQTVATILEEMQVAQRSWAQQSTRMRQDLIQQLGRVLHQHQARIATLMTTEMGKPTAQAIAEIEKCIKLCEYYAENGEAFLTPEPIQTGFYKTYRAFKPIGVIFGIMPWNFPLWQVMRFAVPNLMVGNTALLKHAPNSTGMAALIEQLMLEAGFPEGVFRHLVIDVSLAPFVIHHPAIAGVTLTGSTVAGKQVAAEAGTALKKVVLELGGNDAYVVLDDADLEQAATACIVSRLSNAGQVCIAAKRMIVVDKVRVAFEALLLEKAKAYVMGDPFAKETTLGPMARADLRTKLHTQVQQLKQAGATCVLGGEIPTQVGYYYPATLFTGVSTDSIAAREELFGPVICVMSARDEQDALEIANNTPYGLTATVFTRDVEKGERIARDVFQAGTCGVNTAIASDPRLPFGGVKHSGFGRELSVEGMREFVNIKTVMVNLVSV